MKLHPDALGVTLLLAAGAALAQDEVPRGATLGIETRVPTAEEGQAYGLERSTGRWQGRYVESVREGSAAARAGIVAGLVLIALDENVLCSSDDLSDFLRVARGGSRATAWIARPSGAQDRIEVELDAGEAGAQAEIGWEYAGLGQLDEALEAAKKAGKGVMVGLSGAET
ncbi:MAG: hypothetical protein HY720_29880 [Planctomycetes bacterium]|nr:hypothetical protein [Planctomycetota bacterium]